MENCSNIFSRTCHEFLWGEWGSTVELTLSMWEVSQILIAIMFVVFLKNFFQDPIRRDIAFGYLPTLIVVIKDKASGGLVLLARDYFEKEDGKVSRVWNFPQGVMESIDMRTEARNILETTMGMEKNLYNFTNKYLSLGRRRIKGFDKPINPSLGFSFFSKARGRIYKVIEVETSIEVKGEELYCLGEKLKSFVVEDMHLGTPEETFDAIVKSHEGYERRRDKIPIARDILQKLGYL